MQTAGYSCRRMENFNRFHLSFTSALFSKPESSFPSLLYPVHAPLPTKPRLHRDPVRLYSRLPVSAAPGADMLPTESALPRHLIPDCNLSGRKPDRKILHCLRTGRDSQIIKLENKIFQLYLIPAYYFLRLRPQALSMHTITAKPYRTLSLFHRSTASRP